MHFKYKASWQVSLAVSIALTSISGYSNAQETEVKELDNSELEQITVYGKHNQLIMESGTATKSNMSLMQTPAAVVVVDKLLFTEQAGATLQESLRNVSGLSQAGNNYGVGDNLSIRGLGVNYAYDGMYGGADLENSYNPTRTMTNVESVEVLKGPATGLYGMGNAGGVINLIEKKPQQEEAFEVRATLGQWNNYGVMVDATGGITDDTAFRIVANYETTDGYRDVSQERAELYASLSHDFSDDNKVLVSAAYIDDAIQVDSIGHPVRLIDLSLFDAEPGSITADDFVNGDADAGGLQLTEEQIQTLVDTLTATDGWQPYDLGDTSLISPISTPNDGEELRIKARQDLDLADDWFLMHQLQFRSYSTDYIRQTAAYNYIYHDRNGVINLDPRAPLVEDDVLYPFAARRQEYRNITAQEDTWQYFADLRNNWSSGALRGEHLMSFNYEYRDMEYQQLSIWDADDTRSDPVPYIYDIREPNWPTGTFDDYVTDYTTAGSLRSKYDKTASAWGVSFQEVVYFSDALTARAGGAYSGVSQTYTNQTTDSNPEYDTDDNGFTYNLGLNYQFSDQLATFINHSKGRTAYSILGSLSADDNRPDAESVSWDLGARFTAFDEELLGSIVFFDTARTNLRYSNPLFEDDPEDAAYNIDVPEYYYDEQDRTQGVELDLNMMLNEQWSLNFNATYQDAITEPGDHAASQAEEQTKGIPETFASLWTSYSYEFDGLINPIKFSIGMTYEDERSISASAFGIDYAIVEAYTVWDAAVTYQGDSWDLQLNIDNLTNESYYSKAMYLGGLPGETRNAKLTATYHF
ncbi:TonB-dependent receptor [uncultured Paraglaciecola sp.]|uniref:TonB-dependent receptor n=1 Tax=uncultured Paraglaciecola sp. TaxID=1765024 RepID=UPI0025960B09|nr:TonB-dependent receptor [uncultured Paraglaciecola sp.]